jgi:hypothetical protein
MKTPITVKEIIEEIKNPEATFVCRMKWWAFAQTLPLEKLCAIHEEVTPVLLLDACQYRRMFEGTNLWPKLQEQLTEEVRTNPMSDRYELVD